MLREWIAGKAPSAARSLGTGSNHSSQIQLLWLGESHSRGSLCVEQQQRSFTAHRGSSGVGTKDGPKEHHVAPLPLDVTLTMRLSRGAVLHQHEKASPWQPPWRKVRSSVFRGGTGISHGPPDSR